MDSTQDTAAIDQETTVLTKWCPFDIILTAFLLLRVYSNRREASNYLQTKGLDYLSAWHVAVAFSHSRNTLLLESDLDIELEAKLREPRVFRKKRMSGELIPDKVPQDQLTRFRADFFPTSSRLASTNDFLLTAN